MIERPADEDIYEDVISRRTGWLKQIHDRDVAILGGGITGLFTGVFLEANDCSTIILEPSEYLGGRLNWATGPFPVYEPAHEQLKELEYTFDGNPPVWIERNEFLSHVVGVYMDHDGFILRRCYVEELHFSEGVSLEVSLQTDDQQLNLNFQDFIVANGDFSGDDSPDDPSDPMEYEIRKTQRTDQGYVRAGRSALSERTREVTVPFESAHLLSGRKAAELVLESI